MTANHALQVSIRPLRSEDAAAVHQLAACSPEASQWPQKSYEQLGESGMRGWVAETAETLAGFLIVRVIAPESEILNIAIAPSQRRKGIATALLTEAENTLKKDNVTRVFLEVRESNQRAIAFYKKYGFAATGRRPAYYREPPEPAVLMERKLTA